MASVHRQPRMMLYADQKTIDFFAKVSDLVATPGKVQESPAIEVDGHPWRLVVSATSELLTINVECKIEWPGCAYACATLTTSPGGYLNERFDAEHPTAVLATFPIPTIRRSSHPVRSMRIQVNLRAEPPTSLQAFNQPETPDELSDLILDVQGQFLYVHSVILACMSPVFRSMLYGHFAEAKMSSSTHSSMDNEGKVEEQSHRKVISLPDKDLSLMLEMLSTIYPPQLEVHAIRAKFMLPLYMEYQMTHMITKCERVLCECEIYTVTTKDDSANSTKATAILDEAMDHLFLCSLYKLDRLQQLAINLVAHRRSEDFDQHNNFSRLSTEIQCELYKTRVYRLEKRTDSKNGSLDHLERTSTPDRGDGNPRERSSSP